MISMGHHNFLIFVVLVFCCLAYSSHCYQFVAGGRDGWVVKPSESYNQWAQRMRFQVNDTILFKYKSGSDSVMVVNKDDYDKCNVGNPLLKLDGGNSVFKFDRSGPFYFISGNKANCDQGQKLAVVVMAVRTPPSTPKNVPPPAASPPQGSSSPSPPAGAGPATSPSQSGGATAPPGTSPSSHSPSGGAPAPATSPSSSSPSPSPSGGTGGAPAPGTSPTSPSPSGGAPAPANSPSAGSGAGEGPSPSAAGDMPGSPSGSTTPGAPGSSMPGATGASAPGSGGGAAGETNSPPAPPGSVSAPPCSSSVLMMIISVGLGVFVFSH